MIVGFFVGLSLGLLITRQGHKPLLRFPLRCWFLGHQRSDHRCAHCNLYMRDDDRFINTFWTA